MVAAGTVALASLACHRGPALPEGDIVAALALPSLDGEAAPFDPETLRGKRVLLAFWSPSCPHCLKELPELEAAASGHGNATAVAVMLSGSKSKGLAIARELGFTGPLLVDEDGALKKRFAIDRWPWTFVLRTDGTAAASLIGEHPRTRLVAELLNAN